MKENSPVIYRAARREDVLPATALFVEAVQVLIRRNGLPPVPVSLENRLGVYSYIFETGFFRVAEQDGQIVALANGIVRGEQWFLSGFWVKARLQAQGIGGPLLRQVWEEFKPAGDPITFTWSSIDFTAMASYFKLGMLPRSQILTLAASSDRVAPAPTGSRLTTEPILVGSLEPMLALDRKLRGVDRRQEFAYWFREGSSGFQVRSREGLAGYFFVKDGSIGPAGWAKPEDGEAITRLAIAEAARESDGREVRLMLPGINHSALRAGLAAGLRLTGSAHLLASETFGKMDQYLPSGGLLF